MRTPSIKKSIKARTTGKGQASCWESFNSRVLKKGAGNRECSSIPILMLYFWDHYSRLLEAWFLLSHERLEKYILRYGYQGLLVACLVLLYVCLFLVCWWITEVKKVKSTLKLNVYQKNERAIQFYLREEFSIQSESLDSNTGEKELIMVWKR